MIKYIENEITPLDDLLRYYCIKMPISEGDSNRCVTPDGSIGSCYGCRYHVKNIYRVDK